jgi:glycerol kinase
VTHILAIDQGTTNTKALLVDESGAIVARASSEIAIHYPRPAWVQQDAAALWHSVQTAANACLRQVPEVELAAIGVSNQRESVLAWERATGDPAGPVITWQCRRTAPFCADLAAQGLEPQLRERTGLTIDPLFSASKARWLLDQIADGHARAANGELCIGTVDSWVLWNLTGGAVHACDMTNASRTQLFDLHELAWSDDLLDIFGIPAAALPAVKPSSAVFGTTVPSGELPGDVPVASLIGDSHGALYGHAGFQPGTIKATYGTGSSLMSPTPEPVISSRGLSTTIAWAREHPTYALEGNIYVTGAAVQWLGQFLGFDDPAQGVAALAERTPDAEGVYLVPAFVGLGAPHWDDAARGLITGLTRGSEPAHLARAALESIAYQVRDVFEAMEADSGRELRVLLADGGASRNDTLMQFQADIIDRPVLRSASADVSALGATYLAGLAVGVWPDEDAVAGLVEEHDRFAPQMPADRRNTLYTGWQQAVARAMFQHDKA